MVLMLNFYDLRNSFSSALCEYLERVVRMREYRRKEFVLKAGHICRHIYFVQSGLLRSFYENEEKEVCSWFMKEGDMVLSVESFYQQKVSYESIQALEDSQLYYISYSDLNYIYTHFPECNRSGRLVTEKYYQLWTRQLVALRMKQAPEKYAWLREEHPEFIRRVPAKYLASFLGISEVMLSIIKSKR